MVDPFSRALADPLRPLRIFAPFSAAAAVGFLLAAIVLAATATGAERRVVAQADGPTLTLTGQRHPDLTLYGALADGARPADDVDCTLTSTSRSRASATYKNGTFELDGRTLYEVGKVLDSWSDGDTVSCPGVTNLAAVTGGGPLARMVMAGLALFGGLVATAFALIGFRARKARRAAPVA